MTGAAVLDASTRMLASARAGEWDELAKHVAERDRLLQQLPATDAMAETFRTLLAHNEEIKALVGGARDELGDALGQHRRTHRALNTYLHTAIG